MPKTLTGEDVVAVIEGRPGPLVDGRAYADPGFAAVAEAYHEASLAAHQGAHGVELRLPVFTAHTNGGPVHDGSRQSEPARPRVSGAEVTSRLSHRLDPRKSACV